jgi:hypothetical protein
MAFILIFGRTMSSVKEAFYVLYPFPHVLSWQQFYFLLYPSYVQTIIFFIHTLRISCLDDKRPKNHLDDQMKEER